MNWQDAAETVGRVAPLLGSVLAGSAGERVGQLVAATLGVPASPAGLVGATADPQQQQALLKLQQDHQTELIRLSLEAESKATAEQTARLGEINQTMRAELTRDGIYKSGWRPGIGWVMAFSFAWLSATMGLTIIGDPSQLPTIMDGIITLVVAMGSVLGINITARRHENMARMGQASPTFMDALKAHIAKTASAKP